LAWLANSPIDDDGIISPAQGVRLAAESGTVVEASSRNHSVARQLM
jgi:hypothetical protein